MPESLRGRTAVITGGGRGIGAAVARLLGARGVRIVVAARSVHEVVSVAVKVNDAGGQAIAVECDVSTEAGVAALVTAAMEVFGPIDILVNNAGIAHSATLQDTTLDEWNRVIAVNATSAFLCTRAFLPGMLERKWGRVVNVASMAGLNGARYIAAYTASKHAMVGLTRAVAADIDGSGVTCNAVCPAFVDTHMTDNTIANVVARTGKSPEEMLSMVLATTGQSRLITPDEVAVEVVQLCEVGATLVNGFARVVDGGASG